MIDMTATIVPKSDQLNADDLIGGPITIYVTNVSQTRAPDQPIAMSYTGDGGKPYKPCKSMRRVLVRCWGPDGAAYKGRSITLYRDDRVKFGGAEVGGIRISHLSHIDGPIQMALTETKAKRVPYRVLPLAVQPNSEEPPSTLETAKTGDAFVAALGAALDAAEDEAQRDVIITHPRVAKALSTDGPLASRVRDLINAAIQRTTNATE